MSLNLKNDLATSITGLVVLAANALVASNHISGEQATLIVQVINGAAGLVLLWARDRGWAGNRDAD